MRLLDEDEELNPMLSVVNLVDVFLVVIAALLIAIAQNPLNPFTAQDATVVQNPGKADMRIIVKKGKELREYQSRGKISEGEGLRAGVAYRMADGTMVYVPEDETGAAAPSAPASR